MPAIVTEDLDLPAGVQPSDIIVDVQLVGDNGTLLREAYDTSTGKTIAGFHSVRPDTAGLWSLTLASNSNVLPAGTAWRRLLHGPQVDVSPGFLVAPAAVAASAASRTSNVVTSTVPAGHGLTVGRTVSVDFVDNTYDGTFVIASTPSATSVTWAQTAADDAAAGTGTITGSYRVDEILADVPASIGSAALSAHAKLDTLHGGGQLLGIVQKTDANFTTTAFPAVLIPGMQLPIVVPAKADGTIRPYVVRFTADVIVEDINAFGQIVLFAGSQQIWQDWRVEGMGVAEGRATAFFEAEVPNAIHNPTPGTVVTYEARAGNFPATSDFSVIASIFGGVALPAVLKVVTQ